MYISSHNLLFFKILFSFRGLEEIQAEIYANEMISMIVHNLLAKALVISLNSEV